MTRTSLVAVATVAPASIAASVGRIAAAPVIATQTTSASIAAISQAASMPDCAAVRPCSIRVAVHERGAADAEPRGDRGERSAVTAGNGAHQLEAVRELGDHITRLTTDRTGGAQEDNASAGRGMCHLCRDASVLSRAEHATAFVAVTRMRSASDSNIRLAQAAQDCRPGRAGRRDRGSTCPSPSLRPRA